MTDAITEVVPRVRPEPEPPSTKPVRLAPLDVLSLGLLGIRTRKMRAALSALGIAIGIATMVVVTGIPASVASGVANTHAPIARSDRADRACPAASPSSRRSGTSSTP